MRGLTGAGGAHRAATMIPAIALVAVLVACTADDGPTSPGASPSPTNQLGTRSPMRRSPFDPSAVRIELLPVASGLTAPLAATHAGDGSDRLFVVEQGGSIRIVRDGVVEPRPYLDVSERISSGGERGLLGLAFHPRYRANGLFYVNYTDPAGDTVIAEFSVSDGGTSAVPDSERILLRVDQPFANHNGGGLAFGPDGFLYIALGDGGSGGDPMGHGQRLDTLLGKILRIDVRAKGGRPYSIPGDNPFASGGNARAEVWAYGLRNPFRFSFDRRTGHMWIGDVGQNEIEEIDRAPRGRGGLNFGWNLFEGTSCFESADCNADGLVAPFTEYTHADGCTVIGGFVYRGSAVPGLAGGYLFADYCSGKIWVVDSSARAGQRPHLLLETGRSISSFGEDQAGELYVTDITRGELLRIVAG